MKKLIFILLILLLSLTFFYIGKYSKSQSLFLSENISPKSLILRKGMSMKELNFVIKNSKEYEQVPTIPELKGPYDMECIIPNHFFKDKRVQYSSIRMKNILTKNYYEILIAGNIGNDPDKNEIIGIYKVIDIKKSPKGLMDLYEIYDEFNFGK